MSAIVHLETPVGDEQTIECESVRILGDVIWAMRADDERETVVPMANVAGITGDSVEQAVEQLESPGGIYTELVTTVI